MKGKKGKELSYKMKYLVQTAKELFFRYGIKRVSIEEICQQSGVSKMTFYRYFQNKSDLAIYILDEIYTEAREKLEDIMAMDISFEEKIQKAFMMKMEYMDKFSNEFVKELVSNAEPELGRYIEGENIKSINQMKEILQDAQRTGDIRPDIKIDFMIYTMNIIVEIFKDEKLQKLYPDISSLNKEVFNFFYYGVLKRPR